MAENVKITVDGREIEARKGEVIIQATKRAGIKIPHFCYHAGLSIDGSCRMCLVEVEKIPKLAISCATPVADGMVVHTQSERVTRARRAVMEFLLINHPLDCPICDQAGECKLQEYGFQMAPPHSRYVEPKRKLRKRVDIGKHVLFDEERCILCRRCVRFCREIPKTGELGVFQRGDHSYLDVLPGKQLDNPYSVNTVDICPVGALTDKNFRFRIRPWFLSTTPSICAGCSNGCNIDVNEKDNHIYRFLPRFNEEVNGHWMCDFGRLSRARIESDERLLEPRVREGRRLVACSWEEALARAVSLIKKAIDEKRAKAVAGIGSSHASNESLYVFKRFLKDVIGTDKHGFHVVLGDRDDILIKEEKAPNAAGARRLGIGGEGGMTVPAIVEAVRSGKVGGLYVLSGDYFREKGSAAALAELERLDFLILQDTHRSGLEEVASVVLPSSTHAEYEGTFTNVQGRVQRFWQAMDPIGESRPDWEILQAISIRLGHLDRYKSASEIFDLLASEIEAYRGLNYDLIGEKGAAAR